MTNVQRLTWLLSGMIVWGAAAGYATDTLPKSDPPFKGKVDPSRDKSCADRPQRPSAPKGAPHAIRILLDDVA